MRLDRRLFTLIAVLFLSILTVSQLFAQYGFGNSGRVIHAGGEARLASKIQELSDGSILLSWSRYDSTFVRRGYAQVIESDGSTRFDDGPMSITPYSAIIRDLHLLADDDDGFYLVYGTRETVETGETYAQHFDSQLVNTWSEDFRMGISTPSHEIDATTRSLLVNGNDGNIFFYNTRRISDSRYDARIYASTPEGTLPDGFSVSGRMLQGNIRIISAAAQLSDDGLIFASRSQSPLNQDILVNKTDIEGEVVYPSAVTYDVMSGYFQPILSSNKLGDVYLIGKNYSDHELYRIICLDENLNPVWNTEYLEIADILVTNDFEPVFLTSDNGDLHLIAQLYDQSLYYWHIDGSNPAQFLSPETGVEVLEELPNNARFDMVQTENNTIVITWAGMPTSGETATFGVASINSDYSVNIIDLDQGDNAAANDARLISTGDTSFDLLVAASNEIIFYRFSDYSSSADLQIVLDEYVSYPIASAAVSSENGIYAAVAAQEGLRPYIIDANGVSPSFEENPRGIITHQLGYPVDFSGMVRQGNGYVSAFSFNNQTHLFKTNNEFESILPEEVILPFTAYHMWGHDEGVNFYTIISNNIRLASYNISSGDIDTEPLYIPTNVLGNPIFIDGNDGYGWCVIGARPLAYIHRTANSEPLLPWGDGMPVYVGDTFEKYLCGTALEGMDVALAWLDQDAEESGVYMMRYDTDLNPLFGNERALIHQFDFSGNPANSIADISDADLDNMWIAYSIEDEMLYLTKVDGSGNVVASTTQILSEELDIDNVILRSDGMGGTWVAFHSPSDDLTKVYHVDINGEPESEWWENGPVAMISSRDIGQIRAENLDERGGWLIVAEINAGSALEGLPNPVGVQRLIDDIDNIDANSISLLPDQFGINRAWPNPFNGSLNIEFVLPAAMPVEVSVYDINGRLTEKLSQAVYSAGEHKLNWSSDLNNIASGTYFLKLSTPLGNKVQKVMLVK